jgi:hypothetical protein
LAGRTNRSEVARLPAEARNSRADQAGQVDGSERPKPSRVARSRGPVINVPRNCSAASAKLGGERGVDFFAWGRPFAFLRNLGWLITLFTVSLLFEAMLKLGARNTRMKDFYDLWYLSRRFDFDGATLHRAIQATFDRRQTDPGGGSPYPFTSAFSDDQTKQVQWTAFIGRNRLVGAPARFVDLMVVLHGFLKPALGPDSGGRDWRAGSGWNADA